LKIISTGKFLPEQCHKLLNFPKPPVNLPKILQK
jgi:hypothetical protein